MSSEVGEEVALGKRLQSVRQGAGLTQQQLCDKTGLSYSTLAKIERGAIKSPSIFTIQSIADVIGVSLDELVGRIVNSSKNDKKTSKSGIKFVYFDINGCLVRFFHKAFTSLAKDTGATLDRAEAAFWHYNDDVCRGDMTLSAFNKALAKHLNVDSVDWTPYYLEEIEPIKEMHELLKWAEEHYQIGLMSNIMPGTIDQLIEKGLVPKINYDVIIDSSKVGAIKPEKQIYEIAAKQAGVNPEDILLVDDSRSNVMAGEKMGWHVLWFDDYRPADSAKRVRQVLEF